MGYLAELLHSIYVWKKEKENKRILKLGVSFVEYPFEQEKLEKILKKGCPTRFSKLVAQLKYFLSSKKDKVIARTNYERIKNQIKSYEKLKLLLREVNNGL